MAAGKATQVDMVATVADTVAVMGGTAAAGMVAAGMVAAGTAAVTTRHRRVLSEALGRRACHASARASIEVKI